MAAFEVDAWGLGELWALAELSCGEWQPPLPRFERMGYEPPPPPRWWPELSRVWLFEHEGRPWAWACDSRAECAFDLGTCGHASWMGGPGPVGVPREALLAYRGRSPRGGVRVALDGGGLSVSALSMGYVGIPAVSKPTAWPAMEPTPLVTGCIRSLMEARGAMRSGAMGEGVETAASAADLGRAFTCLGARLSHSFYSPARVLVDGRGRVAAMEGKGGPAAVMRCAGQAPPDDWPRPPGLLPGQ